jgi:hypothetical protein
MTLITLMREMMLKMMKMMMMMMMVMMMKGERMKKSAAAPAKVARKPSAAANQTSTRGTLRFVLHATRHASCPRVS